MERNSFIQPQSLEKKIVVDESLIIKVHMVSNLNCPAKLALILGVYSMIRTLKSPNHEMQLLKLLENQWIQWCWHSMCQKWSRSGSIRGVVLLVWVIQVSGCTVFNDTLTHTAATHLTWGAVFNNTPKPCCWAVNDAAGTTNVTVVQQTSCQTADVFMSGVLLVASYG